MFSKQDKGSWKNGGSIGGRGVIGDVEACSRSADHHHLKIPLLVPTMPCDQVALPFD